MPTNVGVTIILCRKCATVLGEKSTPQDGIALDLCEKCADTELKSR